MALKLRPLHLGDIYSVASVTYELWWPGLELIKFCIHSVHLLLAAAPKLWKTSCMYSLAHIMLPHLFKSVD